MPSNADTGFPYFWGGKPQHVHKHDGVELMALRPPFSAPELVHKVLNASPQPLPAGCSVELRDQLITLLLAGHDTTATGLAWALERLSRHPAVLERAVVMVAAMAMFR